ncbi:MAG: T9SS type A sorting domain-containing protein, partial [Bacteroidetes bacterium]|nr:T9SS type A sorting domain-containing protein [Bacteroidota bacterium]
TYILSVTGQNGCSSTATAVVELDNEVPGAQATGGTLTCSNTSITLHGSGNGSYSWSGPGGFTSTEQNPSVGVAGTYILSVTGQNGCSSTATAVVELDNEVPGAQATGGMLDCTTHDLTLAGTGNGSFQWTGPNGFTSNLQNPTVTAAGVYTLTVTGQNGCTSTASAEVSVPQCGCQTPIITSCGPAVTTVECGSSIDPEDIGLPTTRQNTDCPAVTDISYYDVFTGICPIHVTRHWTIRDSEGNEETCTQTILIADTQAPVLMNMPQDITVNCADVPSVPQDVWASDCKSTVPVTSHDVTVPGVDASTHTILRTFTATDICGNTATFTQVITVIGCKHDCEAPIIIACGPSFTTVECGASIDPEDIGLPVTRKDPDCPEVVYVNYYDAFSGTCPVTVTRHWTFRDVDGNEETCVQTIVIEDTQAPVLMNVPQDVSVDCADVPAVPKDVWASDCKNTVPVEAHDVVIPGQDAGTYTILRTFTATDACDNSVSATQVISVNGCKEACEVPIIIACGPAVTSVPCGASTDPEDIGLPVTRKNPDCPEVIFWNWVDYVTGSCPATIIRHWTFRDADGNEETCDQTIYVGDGMPPKLVAGADDPNTIRDVAVAPNPFRHQSTITFTPEANGPLTVTVVDLAGQQVASLLDAQAKKGEPTRVEFQPERIAGGLYFYRITLNGQPTIGKLMYQP